MALGTCLWRLGALDMVQADLTTCGEVFVGGLFIGVGC